MPPESSGRKVDNVADSKISAIERRLRCQASAAAKLAGQQVRWVGQDVDDAVRASARIALANRWGFEAVYFYGRETAKLLADADIALIFAECDTLLSTLRDYAMCVQEDEWHGQDEPTTEPGDPPSDE